MCDTSQCRAGRWRERGTPPLSVAGTCIARHRVRRARAATKESQMRAFLPLVFCLAACSGSSTPSPNVSAIAISPDPCAVGRTDSLHMKALATMPDGTKKDITTSAQWKTDNPKTATVDAKGNMVGVNAGVTKITVSYEGATGSLHCTVGP
jgi:hypothetical protein